MGLLSMKQILADSVKLATIDRDPEGRYAVGAYNFSTLEEMVGIVEGAKEKKSPVILMASLGAVKYYNNSLELISKTAKGLAMAYPDVPICLHLDHATDLEQIKQAVVAGFTNVMIDASMESFEINVAKSKEIADFAHRHSIYGMGGCSVEAELGMLPGREEDISVAETEMAYTDPLLVREFVEKTEIDGLAVAIGTAHGYYKAAPKIRFDLLEKIRAQTDTALVLHGGTGVPQEDFVKCIGMGMNKINVGTGLKKVFSDGVRNDFDNRDDDPRKLIGSGRKAIAEEIARNCDLFRCSGRASDVWKSIYG